jgi:hypothetical protein
MDSAKLLDTMNLSGITSRICFYLIKYRIEGITNAGSSHLCNASLKPLKGKKASRNLMLRDLSLSDQQRPHPS